MSGVKSKKQIVADLAKHTGVKAKDCESVLDALGELACTEAVNGFRIPGLCRFYAVDQRARHGRNPQTGERILIEARKMLKISPLKKAKDRIAQLPVSPEIAVFQPPAREEPATQPEAGPGPANQTWHASLAESGDAWLTFNCRHCQQEIEASEDLAGAAAVCPGCGAEITVPRSREDADELHTEPQIPFDAMAATSDDSSSKRTTMRIDLSLEDLEDQ